MPFEDVYLVTDRLQLVPEDEIKELEQRLAFPLPLGYREYLSILGVGSLCWAIEVRTPAEVVEELDYWQQEYVPLAVEEEFWDDEPLLSDAEMAETVVFASNSNGDRFVCCPSKGRMIFELPRHDSKMRLIPNGFLVPFDCPFSVRNQYRFPFFEAEGRSQSTNEVRFTLDNNQAPETAWQILEEEWGDSLRIAEGAVQAKEDILSFVKPIQGMVTLDFGEESNHLSIDFDEKCEHEVRRVLERLENSVGPRDS